MKYNRPVVRLMCVFSFALLVLASCKKVNVATELGGDLIPVVDNITTFDTILPVQTFNFPFTTQDSSRSVYNNLQWLGRISNDPVFGTTQANMFFQLQPVLSKQPFAFSNANNVIALDSVVLVMNYQVTYGDTNQAQQVQVFELDQSNAFRGDSSYMIRENNFTYGNALSAVKSFTPSQLNDSIKGYREVAANQLRIRLNDAFGNRMLRNYDSSNAYFNDSAFNTVFKGFAVVASGSGNALVGFNLADTNTKLAFYYRYNKSGTPDTAVTAFRFKPGNVAIAGSASANHIQRNYNGSEFASVAGDQNADALVYIQNAPGTFARVLVPGLASLTNRVVHRAEMIVQQVKDPLSTVLTPPTYLYLDAFDAAAGVYRTIPFDLTLSSSGQPNFPAFGMIGERAVDPAGAAITEWRMNLTRYVQRVANKTVPAYEFRLYSPYLTRNYVGTSTQITSLLVNPVYGSGRVRVGGGSHPTQPMYLRVIYSKL